jgi:hypothetical protein
MVRMVIFFTNRELIYAPENAANASGVGLAHFERFLYEGTSIPDNKG